MYKYSVRHHPNKASVSPLTVTCGFIKKICHEYVKVIQIILTDINEEVYPQVYYSNY